MNLKYKYLAINVLFITMFGYGQNQHIADSLITLYKANNYTDELEILKGIVGNAPNPDDILAYADILIQKGQKKSDSKYLEAGYLNRGHALQYQGEFNDALEAYLSALEITESLDEKDSYTRILIALADTYGKMGNSEKAEQYYTEGIAALRKTSDTQSLGIALLNFGEEHFLNGKYDKALELYSECEPIFEKADYKVGVAYTKGNRGMVYAAQGRTSLAMQNINEAIEILEQFDDYYAISVYLLEMANIYDSKKEYNLSFDYAERSLQLAQAYELKDEISNSSLKLSELHQATNQYDSAFYYYKNHIVYRDSLTNLKEVEKIANLSTAFEVSRKQTEVDLLNQEKKTQNILIFAVAGVSFLIALLALGLYRRNIFIRRTKLVIERESVRSDHLLKNILPVETAKELKENGKVKAKRFDSVSVLFTDFKGFTLHAEHLSPEDLVSSVDYYFTYFDKLMDEFGLEKIKTLGDSYMCAAGLPFPVEDHAERIVKAAMKMIDFVEEAKINNPENKTRFDIRIGINSGPVVAGVVGNKKFAYDIWGDTVNIASRMESNSRVGRINISEDTYKLVKKVFKCRYRGEVDVKNKGQMKMYFIEGLLTKGDNHKIKNNTTADTINT